MVRVAAMRLNELAAKPGPLSVVHGRSSETQVPKKVFAGPSVVPTALAWAKLTPAGTVRVTDATCTWALAARAMPFWVPENAVRLWKALAGWPLRFVAFVAFVAVSAVLAW